MPVTALAPLNGVAPAPLHPQMQEIRRVAEEFEAMVLSELLGPVFEQIDPNGLGGGGAGEQMFRPMLVQQYAAAMARSGGVGLADSVIRELTRLQAPPAPIQTTETEHGADR